MDEPNKWQRNRAAEVSFLRGIRRCAGMLNGSNCQDNGEFELVYSNCREGKPQNNVVHTEIGRILADGDLIELEGFSAALTNTLCHLGYGVAEELERYAARRERILRRKTIRAA